MSISLRRHRVCAAKVDHILCHRPNPSSPDKSQYLLQWKSDDSINPPLSWHDVAQLGSVLDLLQDYIQQQPIEQRVQKRRLDDGLHQLPTPESGRSPLDHNDDFTSEATEFNAVWQRREGILMPLTPPRWEAVSILDVRTIPTSSMLENAKLTRFDDAERAIQRRYKSKLLRLDPPVSFVNDYDREAPSLSFKMIKSYVFASDISRADADSAMLGCTQCRPNMGMNRGCEYTKRCDCLEFAAADESKMDERQITDYNARLESGDTSTEGLPKRFPYLNTGTSAGCLVPFYLNERHPIYECNRLCACGPGCKNRNVQHGRRVRLEVFKTPDKRGFGLRCLDNLRKGQFVDTYLGEVIPDAEASRREAARKGGPSYLFGLDKFIGAYIGGERQLEKDDCYVVDGQDMGGPSRFINHRCGDPNLQMHTVCYNKNDPFVYDLAFFACCDIPAGEELTFDYLDADDIAAGESHGLDNDKLKDKVDSARDKDKDKVPCLCGAPHCRGFLWT